uniref:Uncharacterized protein n=1 Tax=viral metagenome TaxID=1070528 RepID=A0A6M3LP36_9ZZZZ
MLQKWNKFCIENGVGLMAVLIIVMVLSFSLASLRIPEELRGGVMLQVNKTLANQEEILGECLVQQEEMDNLNNKIDTIRVMLGGLEKILLSNQP